jgi:hypothetical protein
VKRYQRRAEPGPNPAANSGGEERRFESVKKFMEETYTTGTSNSMYKWVTDK